MNLVVFDVDGTLTLSSKVDLACFAMTLKKTLGITEVNTNMADYEHATASFIFRHLFHQRHRRNPRPEDIDGARHTMAALLKHALNVKPACIAAVAGARRVLDLLLKHPQWQVAIASGSWLPVLEAKLAHTGLAIAKIPLASAEDGLSREGIVGRARERAAATAGVISFDRIVCVGDGVWDYQTANNLGYGFVGITCEGQGASLQRLGARLLMQDYAKPESFLRALEYAADLGQNSHSTRTGTARAPMNARLIPGGEKNRS